MATAAHWTKVQYRAPSTRSYRDVMGTAATNPEESGCDGAQPRVPSS
jgi:hypothetical protein